MAGSIPRIVIAGATSGVGKTTFATGIMGALARRGLRVQPFKVGPDYIDPSYHTQVAGRPSRNLDSWMVPEPALRDLFARAAGCADIAVVEGVMGLYDGHNGLDESGSSAQVARLLRAPVLLVLDVSKTARSAAAVALGYQQFDRELNLAGVLLNRVGSETHRRWVQGAVEAATGLPVVGYLPRREDLVLPERHLGLIPTAEGRIGAEFFERLIAQVERTVDLGAVERLARAAGPLSDAHSGLFPEATLPPRARLALARDEAFSFYYQDSLELLAAWGAELVPFSPLHDASLPGGAAGVYLGGGFPELFARALSENRPMHQALRAAA
ncbi:MAG: cobyrinate a,c-diamide synthase, partial [Bacteroidetes bacterium]|nr:cobyrinate a,c-diamide synthase [Bacteroidota bacterium]